MPKSCFIAYQIGYFDIFSFIFIVGDKLYLKMFIWICLVLTEMPRVISGKLFLLLFFFILTIIKMMLCLCLYKY